MTRPTLFIDATLRPDVTALVADPILGAGYQPLALDGSGGGAYPASFLSGCCESDGKENTSDGKEGTSDGKEDTSDGKEDGSLLQVADLSDPADFVIGDLQSEFVRVDAGVVPVDVRTVLQLGGDVAGEAAVSIATAATVAVGTTAAVAAAATAAKVQSS